MFDCVLLLMLITSLNKPNIDTGAIIFGFIAFLTINGLFILYYIISNPRWTFDKNVLTIKYYEGTVYTIDLSEVKQLSLTGIKDIVLIFNVPTRVDAIEIKTSERSYFITIDNYVNINELQRALSKSFFNSKDNDFIIESISLKTFENFTVMNKWKMFNFHCLLIIAISFFLLILSNTVDIEFGIALKTIALGLLCSSGYYCPYIIYNEHYIVIKNNLYWWRKKIIRFSDIIGYIHISGGKGPDALIITTKDFKKYSIISNSIGFDNLNELFRIGKKYGISIS
jgi:hypothetical protein